MSEIVEFKAQVERYTEGSFTARIVPFNSPAPMGGGTVEFRRGSLKQVKDIVPLTIDHGDSVLDRVGVMRAFTETDDGAYGSFQLADTAKAGELRELMLQGAVTDVSVGVRVDSTEDGVMFGEIDHVAVVAAGRFGTDDRPSRVLSVHSTKGAEMPEETITAPEVVEYDDKELKAEIVRLAAEVDALTPKTSPITQFSGEEIFGALMVQRHGGKITNHALADVIGDLGAADASGVAPSSYWGAGLQHKIDRRRPMFAVTGAADFPDTGFQLDVPKVTQETLVAKRGAQKSAANTRALQIENNPFPIQFFDGAVDVARELISQSSPQILGIVNDSFRNGWAVATEADVVDLATVAATHTGASLDFSTYGALVADIITTSDLIEDATGVPGDMLAVNSTQWIGILSLMDGGDRRQFAMTNPQNADGSGTLLTRGIDVGGVFIFRSASAVSAVQFNSESLKTAEKSPMQMMSENVALVGVDVGVWGGTVTVTWPEGIYSYEIV